MKILSHRALSCTVLAVAVMGEVNDWAVYVDSCKGYDHQVERDKVAREGDKCSEELAKVLFPWVKGLEYRE